MVVFKNGCDWEQIKNSWEQKQYMRGNKKKCIRKTILIKLIL
jgi:hypothetical protein